MNEEKIVFCTGGGCTAKPPNFLSIFFQFQPGEV